MMNAASPRAAVPARPADRAPALLGRFFLVSTAVALTAVVASVQFVVARGFGDPDGYYHVAMAELFGEGAAGPTFPWLPYTLLGQHFSDQHYLYHGLLNLFLRVPHGAQWSVVAIFLAMLVVLARLLRDMGVPLVPLWLAVFTLGSSELLFRMNLVRPSLLGVLLVTMAVAALYRGRLGWIFCLSVLFPLVYGGFIVLLLVVGVWELVRMVYRASRFPSATGLCVLGLGLGIALHPHPWEYLLYLHGQLLVASVVFIAADTRRDVDRLTPWAGTWLFVMSSVLCACALASRRFVEYWALF